MFDRIIDFVIDSLGFFQFFTVINQYEQGVVFRLGKVNRVIDTGLQFFIPFYIEQIMTDDIVLDTRDLGSQTLTTADGFQIVVTTVISYTICDIVKIFTSLQQRRKMTEIPTFIFQIPISGTLMPGSNPRDRNNIVESIIRDKLLLLGDYDEKDTIGQRNNRNKRI